MYKHWKIREFIANIASAPVRTKTGRRRIRDKIRFHNLISQVGQNTLPTAKYPFPINIAFCFDNNGCRLAAVSIKSLVDAAGDACDYNIYCVIDGGVSVKNKQIIKNAVRGTTSRVHFIMANHDFDASYRASWPVAVYYRTMLPKLLKNIDQIIYADIDVIFCRDLTDVARLNMGNKILAGVRDYNNGYLNSGFLVMNLKQIRAEKLYEKWVAASQVKKYKNPDQDLLNYTTRGRTILLPLKYNFQPMLGSWIFKAHSDMEIHDLRYNLVVLHYSNWMKPWHDADKRPIYSQYWWQTAKKTGLY